MPNSNWVFRSKLSERYWRIVDILDLYVCKRCCGQKKLEFVMRLLSIRLRSQPLVLVNGIGPMANKLINISISQLNTMLYLNGFLKKPCYLMVPMLTQKP
ncbi:unnamed protein product [Oppiella nova]|uniref:Uncharacterized protein n=1 Tax=Oppiella nova TaxID=334625 RepID=A0A7R9L954_9ACAR|nr:unnamed protein product [Oppiella nova]CAG2156671.1 unnamed protein product [Oppiella nova]